MDKYKLTDEEIRAVYNKSGYKPPEWIPEMDRQLRDAQFNKILPAIEEAKKEERDRIINILRKEGWVRAASHVELCISQE